MSGRAEMMRLVKELKRQGFRVERTGSGHWKVQGESGEHVIMGFSPTGTAFHKTFKKLEAIGFQR